MIDFGREIEMTLIVASFQVRNMQHLQLRRIETSLPISPKQLSLSVLLSLLQTFSLPYFLFLKFDTS